MKKIVFYCALGLAAWAQGLYAIDHKKVISTHDFYEPYQFLSGSVLDTGGILVSTQNNVFLWPDPNNSQYQSIYTAPHDAGPFSLLSAVSTSLEGNLAIVNQSPGALDYRIFKLPRDGGQATLIGNFPQPTFPDFRAIGEISADDVGHVAWRLQPYHQNTLSSEVYVDGTLVAIDVPNSIYITTDPVLS